MGCALFPQLYRLDGRLFSTTPPPCATVGLGYGRATVAVGMRRRGYGRGTEACYGRGTEACDGKRSETWRGTVEVRRCGVVR